MLQGWIQIIVFCLVLTAIVPLLGGYMARVFTDERVRPVEGAILRVLRVEPRSQTWKAYAASLLVFSGLFWFALYLILRTQTLHPLNPNGFHSGTWDLSFNTASSSADLHNQLQKASADHKPSLVYFTADWCVSCTIIDREVLTASDVRQGLRDVERIKIDLTSLDDANQALMKDLAVIGPPTMIFFDPSGKEAKGSRLVGEISASALLTSAKSGER